MVFGRILLIVCCMDWVYALPKYNMPQGVTEISHKIFDLHMLIFYICVIIGIVTFGFMFYSLVKHRKSQGSIARKYEHNMALEFVWTVIPLCIVIAMLFPAAKVLFEMQDTEDSQITIKVTGYQWNWRYQYMDEGVDFFSNLSTPQAQIDGKEKKSKWYLLEVDKPLVIPIHTKVRFLFTSNDVNHSWWVPDFGVKVDCLPGYINEGWVKVDRPGTYRGQCTELCGMRHGYMPIVVEAMTKDDYAAWLAKQKGQKVDLKKLSQFERGEQLYNKHCISCHQASGEGMPPVIKALKGSAIVTGQPSKQIHILLNGIQGKAMQSYRDILDDQEIADVITYTRQSWGNDDQQKFGQYAGTAVTKAEVEKMRKGGS